MAKYKATTTVKKSAVVYPSGFGSHKSMIDDGYVEFNSADHGRVICKDDRGLYVTDRKILDSGFCDYNRSVNIELRLERLAEALEGSN